MFIQTVTIKGIRSFRDVVVIENLSPGCTAFVGSNGIAKNDFLSALGLIFNVQYVVLPRTMRKYILLNEVGSTSQRTGYIEVVINIENDRYLTRRFGTNALSFRRDVWMDRDVFRFNGENISGKDMKIFFEATGFSTYFFVLQGHINEIASQNPSQRLVWLKNVAGAPEFDKMKEKCKAKKTEIQQTCHQSKWKLEFVGKKIELLKDDANVVNDYNEYKLLAGMIDFILVSRQLKKLRIHMQHIEELLTVACVRSSDCFTEKTALSANCKKLEEREKMNTTNLDGGWLELNQLMEERNCLLKKKAHLKLRLDDFRKQIAEKTAVQDHGDSNLEEELALQKEVLSQRVLFHNEMELKEQELFDNVTKLEQDKKNLCLKASILKGCATVAERNDRIRSEIETYAELRKNTEKRLGELQEALQSEVEKEIILKQKLEKQKKDVADHSGNLNKSEALGQLQNVHLNLVTEFRECHRKVFALENMLAAAKLDADILEREAYSCFIRVKEKLTGIMQEHFSEIIHEYYYGLVIELIDCPEQFRVAVETALDGWLYHMIVTTTEFAERVITVWDNEHHKGRLEFIALDRLRIGNNATLPRTIPGAVPLIDKLDFSGNPVMKLVLSQIFGRTMLCDSIELCFELSQNQKYNCVTLEGDGVSAIGLITGGRSRLDPCRLEAYGKLVAVEGYIDKLVDKKNIEELKKASIKAELGKLTGEIGNLSAVEFRARLRLEVAGDKSAALESLMESKKGNKMRLEASLETMTNNMYDIDRRLEFLSQELGRDPKLELTQDEQNRSRDLAGRLNTALGQYTDALEQRKPVLMEMANLEQSVIKKLRHKLDTHAKNEREVKDLTRQLKFSQKDIDMITETIRKISEMINVSSRLLCECIEDNEQMLVESDTYHESDVILCEKLMEMDFTQGILEGKFKRADDRFKDAQKRFSKTFMPSAQQMFDYRNALDEELIEDRQFFENMMSKIGNMNFSAPGLVEKESAKFEELKSTFDSLFNSASENGKLLNLVEQESGNAICRAFQQVKSVFEKIFTELVPRGRGCMEIMQDEALPLGEGDVHFNRFTGIGLSATFDAQTNDGRLDEIQRVSGCEKWLTTLALLFAVQRGNPSPLYMFDELDQGVGDTYIYGLADYIRRMFEGNSLMMVTSRQPMLDAADSFFGITTENGMTKIAPITKQSASDLLTRQ